MSTHGPGDCLGKRGQLGEKGDRVKEREYETERA